MPIDPANPFSAPTASLEPPVVAAPVGELDLAPASTRFLAVLLDGLLFVPVALIAAFTGYSWRKTATADVGLPSGVPVIVLVGLYCVALLAYQIYLLTTTGQTLGKRWMKIKIVKVDGSPAGFVHAVLLRSVVNGLPRLIPGLGNIYSVVDAVFIFRKDRRCIHDHIASTRVILARSPQP